MPRALPPPEYIHVLSNHLPLTGLAVASVGLFLALLTRNGVACRCALVVVLACAAAAWPVYLTGHAAYRNIRRIADDAGTDQLDEHLERADRWTVAYLPAALLAGAALGAGRFRPRIAIYLTWATLLGAAGALAAGAYVAQAGGLVRHAEFRLPTPPNDDSATP